MTYCNLFQFLIQRLVQIVGQFQPAKSSFHVFSNEWFIIQNQQNKDTNINNMKKQVMLKLFLNYFQLSLNIIILITSLYSVFILLNNRFIWNIKKHKILINK